MRELLQSKRVSLNVAHVTDQDERAPSLIEAGVGVAIVPEHHSSPGIVKRPLVEAVAQRSIGFEWGDSENREEVDRFVAFARIARWP